MFVLLFLICIAAEDGCISFLTHYREIQPSVVLASSVSLVSAQTRKTRSLHCSSFPHKAGFAGTPYKRPGRTPTAVSAAVHGSVLFRVLVAFHTRGPEGLGHLVDYLVLAVGHSRRGRQLARLPGFSLAHLLKLRTLAEMLEEEVLL